MNALCGGAVVMIAHHRGGLEALFKRGGGGEGGALEFQEDRGRDNSLAPHQLGSTGWLC